MQTDPIGYADGMNLYNYVGGDPVNKVDPMGLAKDIIVIAKKKQREISDKGGGSGGFMWPVWFYSPAAGIGDNAEFTEEIIVVGKRKPQKGLLDRAKDAFCSVGSFEIGSEGATFLGAGIRYSGGLA